MIENSVARITERCARYATPYTATGCTTNHSAAKNASHLERSSGSTAAWSCARNPNNSAPTAPCSSALLMRCGRGPAPSASCTAEKLRFDSQRTGESCDEANCWITPWSSNTSG